jgi:hypothetical protein
MFDFDFSELFGFGPPELLNPLEGLDLSEIPEMPEPIFELGLTPDFSWVPPEVMDSLNIGDILAGLQGGGGGGGGGSGGFDWGGLLKSLGLSKSGNSLDAILPLLSIFGALATGINNTRATSDAGEKIANAAKESNAKAEELFGGARSNFAPYITAGQGAIPQIEALLQQPGIAGKFGKVVAPSLRPIKGGMTVADLAKR